MDTSTHVLDVPAALAAMQQAVRSGRIQEATALGSQATVPLAISPAELQIGGELAAGSEAVVHQGRWHGEEVAIKKFRIAQSDDLERFRRELAIMASMHHPNIMPVLGARALPPQYMLVMPLAADNMHVKLYEQGWKPSWRTLLKIGLEVADALAYVHSKGIVHRDVKPGNLMQGFDGRVWLSDFGISASLEEAEQQSNVTQASVRARGKPTGGFHKRSMVGTLEYMAPEVLNKRPHTNASDVYAFAITLNQLATGIYPFSDCTKDNPDIHTVLEMGYGRLELAAAVAAEGLRPTLPKQAPPAYAALLNACWHTNAAQRPSFVAVREALAQMLAGLGAWEKVEQLPSSFQTVKVYAGIDPTSDDRSCASSATMEMLDIASVSGYSTMDGSSTIDGCSTMDEEDMLGPGSPTPYLSGSNTHGTSAAMAPGTLPPTTLGLGPSSHGASFAPAHGAAAAPHGAASVAGASTDAAPAPTIAAGVFAAIGPRDSMEDRHIMMPKFGGAPGTWLLGVFDGHRGSEAAEFAAGRLPRALQLAAASSASAKEALVTAFEAVDTAFWREWQEEQHARASRGRMAERFPGCTALAAVISSGRLFVANAGDSKALLSRGGRPVPLSRLHTAALEDERSRVQSAGGRVAWRAGGWRVGDAALQVTRSIGDFDLKGAGGVVSEPEVAEVAVLPEDEFVVLATDGLWDVVSDAEVVGLVHDTVKSPELSAKRLAMEALARGSRDNVTVVVAFLQPMGTLEQVYAAGRVAAPSFTRTFFGSRRRSSMGAAPTVEEYAASASADEVQDVY